MVLEPEEPREGDVDLGTYVTQRPDSAKCLACPVDWQIPSCHVTTQTILHFRTEEHPSFIAETAVVYCQGKLDVRATAARIILFCIPAILLHSS